MTQKWCDYTPAVRPEQMIAGFTLIATGYPLGMAFSTSIFSKILGPIPQVWTNLHSFVKYVTYQSTGHLDGRVGCWRLFGSIPVPNLCCANLRRQWNTSHFWFYGQFDDLWIVTYCVILQTSDPLSAICTSRNDFKQLDFLCSKRTCSLEGLFTPK